MENSGTAIMGSAKAEGENRSREVIMNALDSPLLNDNKITGAKNVLLLILSGKDEITIDEISEINDFIQEEAGNSADVIMGIGEDENLGDAISVTIIATGFNKNQQDLISNAEPDKIVHVLKDENVSHIQPEQNMVVEPEPEQVNFYETPTEPEPDIVAEIDDYGNTQFAFDFKIEPKQKPVISDEISEQINESTAKKEAELSSRIVEERIVEQPLLFNFDEEKPKDNFDEVEDLTELPIEIALKLRKRRKSYMKNYTTQLDIKDDHPEEPAFKKKGIDVDLSPKSSKDIHKIEMDIEGNFTLRDTNSFLEDNVD